MTESQFIDIAFIVGAFIGFCAFIALCEEALRAWHEFVRRVDED